MYRPLIKALLRGLTLLVLLAAARTASAYTTGLMYTSGGQTQYNTQQYNLCLTVEGSSNDVYSDVCGGSGLQQQLTFDGTHMYWVSGGSTYCMGVTSGVVSMQSCTYSSNQVWVLHGSELRQGSYCLGVSGGSTSKASMVLQSCGGEDYQSFWTPGPDLGAGGGGWTFFNIQINSTTCSGAPCCLAEETSCHGLLCSHYYDTRSCSQSDPTQEFTLTSGNQISNVSSGRCVTVDSNVADSDVIAASCSGGSGLYQLWYTQQWANSDWTAIQNYGPYGCLYYSTVSDLIQYDTTCSSVSGTNSWSFDQN